MTDNSFRGYGDTGPARGMHGFAAPAQVAHSSDFGGVQTLRQEEYAALAKQLDGVVDTMKSLGSALHARAGNLAKADDSTALGQFGIVLRKAKGSILKAETADEDNLPEDAAGACETAGKLLRHAAKLLGDAMEDAETDEDEEAVTKAQASYKKLSARLASLKSKPAPVAAAPTAISAKAVEELDKQTNVLKAQLADVIEMLGQRSRSAGSPPNFAVVKAEGAANANGIPSNREIEQSIEAGLLPRTHGADARLIAQAARAGDLESARARRDRSSDGGIHSLFGNI